MVGPLPEWLACMSNLIEIDLEENDFTGTIPRTWGNLRQLEEVEGDASEDVSPDRRLQCQSPSGSKAECVGTPPEKA